MAQLLCLRFNIECNIAIKRGSQMDEDRWAQQTAEKIRKLREDQKLKQQAFVAEEEIRKTEGPVLWEDFKSALKAQASSLSSSLSEPEAIAFSTKSGDEVSLSTRNGTTVTAEFNRERLSVECFLISTAKSYKVQVFDGRAVFMVRGEGIKTVERAARECVEAIVPYI